MDFGRREFFVGMSAFFAHQGFVRGAETDYVELYFQKQIKTYGPPLAALNFADRRFTFNGESISVNTRRFCYFNYDLDSSTERFLVVNKKSNIELTSLASHGVNSGNKQAWLFSNSNGSLQSSLGIFVTGKHYVGRFGPSINLHGVSPSNDQTFDRRIVIHGADYCSTQHIDKYGFLGRSLGCMALPKSKMISTYQLLQPGTLVFTRYENIYSGEQNLIPPTDEERSENKIL